MTGDFFGLWFKDRNIDDPLRFTAMGIYEFDGSGGVHWELLKTSHATIKRDGETHFTLASDGCFYEAQSCPAGILSTNGEFFIHGNAYAEADQAGLLIGFRRYP